MRISTLPTPRMGKTAPIFCRNERWEAKPATVFIKKWKKLRIPWAESSKIDENCKFRGRNRQKTAKTVNSVGRIVKNRRKLQIPWAESSEIGKNCKFRGRNHQKTAKTTFPARRKRRKQQKRQVLQNEDPNFAPPGCLYIFLKTNSLKINNRAL